MSAWRFAPLAALCIVAAVEPPFGEANTRTSLFGSDEFGRSSLLVLLAATGRSVVYGGVLATVTLSMGVLLALWCTAPRGSAILKPLDASARILESVPLLVWVLAAFSAVRGRSELVPAIIFVLAVLPATTTILADEFMRLSRARYVDAARLLGVRNTVIAVRHLLPNAAAVLAPLFIQVLGIAAAIRGAIGFIGFGRRTDLDLGTLLLRGYERVGYEPWLLASAVGAFFVLYLYLAWLAGTFGRLRDGAPAGATEQPSGLGIGALVVLGRRQPTSVQKERTMT